MRDICVPSHRRAVALAPRDMRLRNRRICSHGRELALHRVAWFSLFAYLEGDGNSRGRRVKSSLREQKRGAVASMELRIVAFPIHAVLHINHMSTQRRAREDHSQRGDCKPVPCLHPVRRTVTTVRWSFWPQVLGSIDELLRGLMRDRVD